MRYHIIAIDYDGTLAEDGKVSPQTVEILRRVKISGRKIVLVTGRILADLEKVFPEYKVFDYIIAENGSLIHCTENGKEELLGQPPPAGLITELQNRGVSPLYVGKVIAATWVPHEKTVLDVIKQSGIELQVIFNKGAVMILPPAVNKATGLQALLKSLHFSIHNTVAIGDAENDSALLEIAEYAVAVNNALPALKKGADFVTTSSEGSGVRELLEKILDNEHAQISNGLTRHYLHLGTLENQQDFSVSPYRPGILLTGVSEAGKSTFATAIAETMAAAGYQFCLVDPEGDYLELPQTVIIGNNITIPSPEEIVQLLKNPQQNLVICMLSVPNPERPVFFNALLKALLEMRRNYGHPHWLLLDEAHHLMPSHAIINGYNPVDEINNFILISTSPGDLNHNILSAVETVITLGDNEIYPIEQFCAIRNCSAPVKIPRLSSGEAGVWDVGSKKDPYIVRYKLPEQIGQRHKRKYALGDMSYNSFIFTGRKNRLHLKANNLMMFVQLAEGIDDDTWLYHLGRSDYKNWAVDCINDTAFTRSIETAEKLYPNVGISKKIILDYIRENYAV